MKALWKHVFHLQLHNRCYTWLYQISLGPPHGVTTSKEGFVSHIRKTLLTSSSWHIWHDLKIIHWHNTFWCKLGDQMQPSTWNVIRSIHWASKEAHLGTTPALLCGWPRFKSDTQYSGGSYSIVRSFPSPSVSLSIWQRGAKDSKAQGRTKKKKEVILMRTATRSFWID